jgi:hypothetical protein
MIIVLLTASAVFSQSKIVAIPDIPGYITFGCDFHLHTFS